MKEGHAQTAAAGGWYHPDGEAATTTAKPPASQPSEPRGPQAGSVEWTASEFIAHHKSFGWYAVLFLGTALLAGLVYLVTRDMVAFGVVLFCGFLFGFTGARKPRVITCRLDNAGITIGRRFYPYGHYKAFALVNEGAFSSIVFLPLKRFALSISAYFAPDDEKKIVEAASAHLPLQQQELSPFDNLMRSIRF